MTQLTEEQQRRVEQIKRYSRLSYTVSDDNQVAAGLLRDARTDIDFLVSLLDSDSQAAERKPSAAELTAASVLDQSLDTLRQIRDLTASSRSYVPQNNAAEMMLRLEALGFGSQEPRRGNTLWAMVMDATDEIESLRKSDPATAMRDKCVEKVRSLAEDYNHAWARQALVEAARELQSVTLDQVKPGEM